MLNYSLCVWLKRSDKCLVRVIRRYPLSCYTDNSKMTNISIKPISTHWVTAQLLLSMTCVCFCYSVLTSRGGASRLLAVRRAEAEQRFPSNWVKGFTWRGLHQWRRDRWVVQTLCTYKCVCTEGLEWLDYQLLDQLYSLKYIQNTACCFYFCSAPQDRLTTEKCLTVGRISPIITSNTNRTPCLFLPEEIPLPSDSFRIIFRRAVTNFVTLTQQPAVFARFKASLREYESMHTFDFRQWNYKEKEYFQLISFLKKCKQAIYFNMYRKKTNMHGTCPYPNNPRLHCLMNVRASGPLNSLNRVYKIWS